MFFFFSSRRRHTRFDCDWSSDVCSSDLGGDGRPFQALGDGMAQLANSSLKADTPMPTGAPPKATNARLQKSGSSRSEERRVGKECRSRWSRYNEKKK